MTHLTMPIIAAQLFYYHLPLRKTLNFNGQQMRFRNGLILQLQDSNKQLRYGEIAPLPGFSHEQLAEATEQIIARLEQGVSNLAVQENDYPSIKFALDSALQGVAINDNIRNIDPVPLLQGDNKRLSQQYMALHRPALVKLKVARQDVEQDVALFKQLNRLNPRLMIRCDANQQWSAPQADYFFTNINKQHLDYIEEPTADHQVNLALAEKHQIGLGLDETLQNINFHYHPHAYIKALILKPTLIGSLTRIEQFIEIAIQQSLQVHISASFESIIGLQQLTALANRYQAKCQVSLGIDTLQYFQPGLLTNPRKIPQDVQKLECLWRSN